MLALDHYVGRKVTKIHKPKNKSGIPQHQWVVELDGGVMVTNHDEERDKPPHGIEGKSLHTVIFGPEETKLVFGRVRAVGPDEFEPFDTKDFELTPTKYSIADRGEEEFPQQLSDEERAALVRAALPPDPSTERALDGPVEPQEGTDA